METLDATIRRDAQLLRFGTYLKREYIVPTIQELSKDIPRLLSGFDELNKMERTKLAREIRKLVAESMGAMFDEITSELHALTDDEAAFMYELYNDLVPESILPLVSGAVVATANNALISLEAGDSFRTGVWADFIKSNIDTATQRVDGIVLRGFRDGMTLQAITSELRGSYNRSTKQYMGGVLNGTLTRYAETLARTGISHYSNQARDKFAAFNKDVITEAIFFATLDNSTTTICLGKHLNRYKLDDPAKPVFPLHYGERSVYVFATEGADPLDTTRPVTSGQADGADEFNRRQSKTDKKVKYKGRKDSDIFDVEQVSAKVTSQKWLERQPRYFIESVLGKTRAKLFIEGKLPIERFTDLQGRQLTLDELRDTAAGERAWRKAGLI